MIRRRVLTALLPFSLALANDSGNTARVDALFSAWNKPDSPGCAVGIIRNKELVYSHGYGSANLDYGIPLGPDSVFYIASTSKQFTAASIGVLIKQGKLSLDDEVHKYVPELPDYGVPVRIRDLIYHSSGIPDVLTLMGLAGMRTEDVHSEAEFLNLIARVKPLNYPAGEEFQYSNSGYFLAGIIVHRVSGKSLREFAAQELFEPLGMQHTLYRDDHTMVIRNLAVGYSKSANGFSVVATHFDQVGDGGVMSTVNDLVHWDRESYEDKLGLQKLLLTPGKLNDGTTLDYAFGLFIHPSTYGREVSHGGIFNGYRADLIRYPEQKTSVICLCNLYSIDPTGLAKNAARIYLGDRPAPAHHDAAISADAAAKFAASYREDKTGEIWTFRANGAKLSAHLLGVPQSLALAAIGPTELHTIDPAWDTSFDFGNDAVSVRRGQGKSVICRRVELAHPADLMQYAGAYRSDELEVTYRFLVKGQDLVLTTPILANQKLVPTIADGFFFGGYQFVFTRGSEHLINGFRVSANGGSVRNIYFHKL